MDEGADSLWRLLVPKHCCRPTRKDSSVEIGKHHAEACASDVGCCYESMARIKTQKTGRTPSAGFTIADRLNQSKTFQMGDAT
jgi:hypothetical protein